MIVFSLIYFGANVNLTTSRGQTPLHYAAMAGTVQVIRCLMEYGADWRHPNCNGKSALDLAQEYGRVEAVAAFTKGEAGRFQWYPQGGSGNDEHHVFVITLYSTLTREGQKSGISNPKLTYIG